MFSSLNVSALLRSTLMATVGSLALGVGVIGCSGGGGGGGGSASTALPSVQRSASYTFETAYDAPAAVQIGAIGAAPLGSGAVFLAGEPGTGVVLNAGGSNSAAQPLATGEDVRGFVLTPNNEAYAGTGSGASGALYSYDATAAGWNKISDLPGEVAVAVLGNEVFAFAGSTLSVLDGAGLTRDVAVIASMIATCAAPAFNEVWVGGTSPTGRAPTLYRGTRTGFTPAELPTDAFTLTGDSAQVTALAEVGGALVVGLATYDLNGQPTEGVVLHYSGAGFEVLTRLTGAAPLALAEQDNTLYVGTSDGRLLYRDSDGSFSDEPNLPALDAISALYASDSSTLWIGARGPGGALALRRVAQQAASTAPTTSSTGTGNNTPPATTTPGSTAPGTTTPPSTTPGMGTATPGTPAALTYVVDAKAILQGCDSCHTNRSGFRLSRFLTDDAADYQSVLNELNIANPEQSDLLLKATGQVNHGGGPMLTVGSPNYQKLVDWIGQGARFN